jgi:hypothetical protein
VLVRALEDNSLHGGAQSERIMMEGPDWYARPKSELSQAPHADSLDDIERVAFATFGVRAAARLLDEVAMGVVGFVGGIIARVILTLLSASGLVAFGW